MLFLSYQIASKFQCIRNADRRKEWRQFGWPQFESIEEIAASDIDLYSYYPPPNARINIVKTIATTEEAILMEKPVERDLPLERGAIEICEIANVPLGIIVLATPVSSRCRSDDDKDPFRRSGRCSISSLHFHGGVKRSYYEQPGRGTYAKDGGGVLITQAIHVLDLMLSLTGPAHEVVALTGTTKQHRMEAENFATAGIRFENETAEDDYYHYGQFPGMLKC